MPGTSVLFENDRVRVWEMKVPPGGAMPEHTHELPYFYVVVDGAKMRIGDHSWHPDEGDAEFYEIESGKPKQDPRMVNEGQTTHREIVVELKDAG